MPRSKRPSALSAGHRAADRALRGELDPASGQAQRIFASEFSGLIDRRVEISLRGTRIGCAVQMLSAQDRLARAEPIGSASMQLALFYVQQRGVDAFLNERVREDVLGSL